MPGHCIDDFTFRHGGHPPLLEVAQRVADGKESPVAAARLDALIGTQWRSYAAMFPVGAFAFRRVDSGMVVAPATRSIEGLHTPVLVSKGIR